MGITEDTKEHNGAIFNNFRSSEIAAGVAAIGDKRFVFHGKPKICLMNNSYKFGKEIQFSIFNLKSDNVEESRNSSNYNAIEINMSFDEAKALIKEVSKKLDGV